MHKKISVNTGFFTVECSVTIIYISVLFPLSSFNKNLLKHIFGTNSNLPSVQCTGREEDTSKYSLHPLHKGQAEQKSFVLRRALELLYPSSSPTIIRSLPRVNRQILFLSPLLYPPQQLWFEASRWQDMLRKTSYTTPNL